MRPQGLRALLWLRSRELLGTTRDTSRLWVLGFVLLGWCAVCTAGAQAALSLHTLTTTHVGYLVDAAWPLWALLPLLGGGAGEVASTRRLAAYPVPSRAVFAASWLTGLLEVPYLVVAPVVIALSGAVAGPRGWAAAACLVAGASGVGQLAAWAGQLALAGRRRSGLLAVGLTGAAVGLVALAPHLAPGAARAARLLPPGWLAAAEHSHGLPSVGWLAALLSPAVVALAVGPRLAMVALRREARAGGASARGWGRATWWARAGADRALIGAALRSCTRATGAQVAIAGVLAVPALTRLPGVAFAAVSLPAMGTVAAVAAAAALAINAFAFDAGGATLLFSWPLSPGRVLRARAAAIASCLLAAQLAVTLGGVVAVGGAQLLPAVVLDLTRTVSLTGLGLAWSVWFPAGSDYDSLRARVAPVRSLATFAPVAAAVSYLSTQVVQDAGLAAGLTMVGVGSLALAAAGYALARGRLMGGAGAAVAVAVRG